MKKVQPQFLYEKTGLPAVIGTDCQIWLDGRWSRSRTKEHIEWTANEYASTRGLVWTGDVYVVGQKRVEKVRS